VGEEEEGEDEREEEVEEARSSRQAWARFPQEVRA